ncbi:toll-like receptor 5 [Mastomys coucha]|uniref:toll-like receptor 5 n=1 Tax=Mastomys coucha TaxID=35658 RepID=UPI00126252DA|nr:toll-like receptor 5 [Mastomys coucha]XP_031193253.1 toll-like receptor 5 [Mastomys coucha]XP_031193260.1 toll-like receptor 5 [Mastomys coucha]XP_031193261.1 toll-like receptor 5 [Mastomys coucha]
MDAEFPTPPPAPNFSRIMAYQLDLLVGVIFMAGPVVGIAPCSSDGRIALFRGCNLTQVPWALDPTIESLLLSFNSISSVVTASFPLLEQLQLLELGTQYANMTIGPEAFRNLPNLRILDLGLSQIEALNPDAFQGLPHLLELRLFACGLSSAVLRDGYFRNLYSLARLDLSGNEIDSLHLHSSFQELDSLSDLNFAFNQIFTLCEDELKLLQGRTLSFFGLKSTGLFSRVSVVWETCRNPFGGMRLETLDLSENGWTAAIAGNFSNIVQGSQISNLIFKYHIMGPGFGFQNIKDPDRSTFASLSRSSVLKLDLSHGYIFSLNPRLFETLKDLKSLNLAFNKINKIGDGAFYGLDSLQVLNLSYNLLGELYDSNFYGLPRVAYIDLQRNHIGIIQDKTFRLLNKLQTLDLRDNALKTIGFIPSIQMVFLGGNKLIHLPYIRFTANFIELSENRLESLSDLYFLLRVPQLQFLILNQNRLSSCKAVYTTSENPSLEQLFLAENMLQLAWETGLCWDVFKGLSGLQVLYLNNNYLNFLPPGIFKDLVALQKLSLSANKLTVLSPGSLPANLEVLDISRNQLFSPDPGLFSSLHVLDITHNEFVCDCELRTFIFWLNHVNVTLSGSPEDIYCMYPNSLLGSSVYNTPTEDCDEEEAMRSLKFSLFILCTVTLAVFLIIALIVVKFRGICFLCYKTLQRLVFKDKVRNLEPSGYRYDAYFCFSSKDFEWAQNALLKHLDAHYSSRNRLRLCFEERDFIPGENHISNIQAAVWGSRKTVCLVSRHFLRDGWCLEAFRYAQSRCLSDLKSVLIVVVVGSLSQYQLMRHETIRGFLQKQQYLRWPEDLQDVDWFLDKLSGCILKEEKGKKSSSSIQLRAITTIS